MTRGGHGLIGKRFVDGFVQRHVLIGLVRYQKTIGGRHESFVSPEGVVILAKLVDRFHHLVFVVQLARAFGDVIEALGIGLRVGNLKRA